jgi:hypothetical protein
MSLHNFYDKLNRSALPATGIALRVPGIGHLLGWGPTASKPTGALTMPNGDSVWAPGAIWIDTTTKIGYYNNSTTSTVSFAQMFTGAVTALDMTAGTATITLKDADSAALDIKQGANSYMKFITTDSGEKILISKAVDASETTVNAKVAVINAGASTALTAAQSGSLVLLNSSDVVTLPAPAAGIWFDFITQTIATQTPRINPNAAESVYCKVSSTYAKQAAGKYVAPIAIGDCFRMWSDGTDWWTSILTVFTVEG